ncbi:MAG TPA: DegT/DnrJ/EryC1/StrS family aminotransferase [Chromatiales bacterium]|nr:DegT/DnrJ/EryC1/StrS family aminotransferase [Chromatiales bacterium]
MSQRIPFIDLKTQFHELENQIRKKIDAVLAHGQYIMGPEMYELEEKLADYVRVKHCIAVSSGSDSLLIAMMALGIGAGDEVITTPFTFIATGEMITLLGAKPVFVDIDPRTYNIDPGKIEAVISKKTKAIMPVSLYGQCADFDVINAIAEKHNLPVIEDGAQSFGATYKGKRSCGLSTIGSTSFFPSKPLGCYGEGGALFTNDNELAKLMREIRVHGQSRRYYHPHIGVNGRLDTIQAAILLAKLERFDWEVEKRAELGQYYSDLITQSCPAVITPHIVQGNTSVYAQYTIQIEKRDAVAERLNASGIPTAVHYPVPLNEQPVFIDSFREIDTVVSKRISSQVLSLPFHPYIERDVLDEVVEKLC